MLFVLVCSLDSSPSNTSLTDEIVRNVAVAIFCVIIVAGALGNGLVIFVTGFRMKKTVNSVWFLNLALADFLFTAFLIFFTISFSLEHWPFGHFMCKLNTFVTVVNMFASIFLLTVISLDRCLCIWVVVWAQNKRTVRKAQLICAIIWAAAAACSATCAAFRKTIVWEENVYCVSDKDNEWSLAIFRFTAGFLIPFLVIFLCYVAIGIRAGRLQRKRKKRSRRIIFSVIVAFFLCWLPFHVLQFIRLKCTEKNIHTYCFNIKRIAGPFTLCLAFINSCLNPVLYVFMCDEFQTKLKKSLCFVLESALAEDHLSFMSSRSLSFPLARISSSTAENKGTVTS